MVDESKKIEQQFRLKKLVKQLEAVKGRHTELVSVYVPAGTSLNDINNILANEIALTQNVKSKAVRKNVIDALTKIAQHLKLYKKNPEHGLAIFCGNVSEQEGKTDMKLWVVEPPEPVTVKLYWCDQRFELEHLKQQLKEKEVYGLAVLDTKEATIGLLKGKSVQVLRHLESIVPGKFIKGGQSAARFSRVREGLINDWYKEIGGAVKAAFPAEIKGIIIGGPGMSKDDFLKGDYAGTDLKNKVLGTIDVGYTSEQGLHEMIERSGDILKEASISREREIVNKFLTGLQKDTGLSVYGIKSILKALESGAAELILISEGFDWKEFELICASGHAEKRFGKDDSEFVCAACGQKMQTIGEMDGIDAVEQMAEKYNTKVEIISQDTREGEQLFQLGGIGAMLRWRAQ
ncbi:MAG: peptide chain release factor aRF-1 [Nanoarchaeota archaeon]|nr:peptide chain release factor aRF-1 [Nanoarchaeota archaeon]